MQMLEPRLKKCEMIKTVIRFILIAEYWGHGESNSSEKGEPVKIKVEKINEPLKVVVPFPKRVEP